MAKKRKHDTPRQPDSADRRHRSKTRSAVILLCLCAVAALTGATAFDRLPSPIGDNAEFAVLARALAGGHGLRYINHPDLVPATKYPPGFPLLLAAWIPLFGGSMIVMKIVVFVCYVLLVPATFLLARRFLAEGLSVICALLVATSGGLSPAPIGVVAYSHEVLSDVPYALFSVVGLLLLLRAGPGVKNFAVAAAVVLWAYIVRTAGLSLVAAAALFLLVRSRRRQALALVAGFVVFSVLWTLRNHLVGGEGSRYLGVLFAKNPYDPDLGAVGLVDVLRRMGINLWAYLSGALPENVLPALAGYGGSVALRTLASLLIVGLAVLGGWGLRAKGLLLSLYAGAYLLMYLFWPEVWRGGRFMVPLAPVLAIYFVEGVAMVCRYVSLGRAVTLALCIAIGATNVYAVSKYAARPRGYPPGWANYLGAANWAAKNTNPSAVFLCRSTYLFYIFSGRRTIQYPFTHDVGAMRDYLSEHRPDYIVLDNELGFPQTQTYLVPALRTMENLLEPVYSTGEPVNSVVRFVPPSGGGGR